MTSSSNKQKKKRQQHLPYLNNHKVEEFHLFSFVKWSPPIFSFILFLFVCFVRSQRECMLQCIIAVCEHQMTGKKKEKRKKQKGRQKLHYGMFVRFCQMAASKAEQFSVGVQHCWPCSGERDALQRMKGWKPNQTILVCKASQTKLIGLKPIYCRQ